MAGGMLFFLWVRLKMLFQYRDWCTFFRSSGEEVVPKPRLMHFLRDFW
jgi:hypothetical protein